MKHTKSCGHPEAPVVLYFYDELTPGERAEVEVRLQGCAGCQAVLEGLQQLQQVVPATPSVSPDEATMEMVRRAAFARLRPAPRPASVGLAAWLRPAPLAARLALAVLLVAAGFWWGAKRDGLSTDLPPAFAMDQPDLGGLLLAGETVQTGSSTIEPTFGGVEEVTFDAAAGTVQIRYNTFNEVTVQGRADDVVVRRLLQQALMDQENPAVRLHAARVLGTTGETALAPSSPPDAELVATLVRLIEEEPNDGIRLQALQALRTLHFRQDLSPSVKKTLLGVLLNDKNSAIRIEALQSLTAASLVERDLSRYLQALSEDDNSFIRLEAARLLDTWEAVPLEQVPVSPATK